ncbi:MAG: tetratricopeptide repeat protein [Planctomycetes bacterium]|nr:tetratricopeptide repeat protein [Planctomycetota bacterium]
MLQGNKIVRFLSLLFLCLIVSLIGCGKEASAATSLMRNKTDDAIGKIEEFITSNPEHYEAYYSLGTLYEEKGMLDEALKAFNETSRLKPSSVDSLIRQGRIFNKIGQYDEAITVFEKAFGINRNRMEIYYYLGIAYKKAGKPDNTMLLWQGAIRKIDDTSNIYYLKGLVAKEKGDFESAEDLLKKAIELKPDFSVAHRVLESLYCFMGNYGDAYRHAEIHRKNLESIFQVPISQDQQHTREKQIVSVPREQILPGKVSAFAETFQEDSEKIQPGEKQTVIITNIHDALRHSGKTKMLAMKMAKLYGVQVVNDYPIGKRERAKKELGRTIKITNGIYRALLAFAQISENREVAKAIGIAQTDWHKLENELYQDPTQRGFLTILNMSDNLLEKNQQMTKYLESLTTYAYSELIDIAGLQRMYSMRLARDYLAVSMGLEKEQRMDLMIETLSTFDSAMLTLEDAAENTAEIKGLIKSITKMEWRKVFKTVNKCIEDSGKEFNVLVVVNFCEILLEKTDRLTELYVDVTQQNTST